MLDAFDASNEQIEFRRSSIMSDQQGWDEFFEEADPATPNQMTLEEFKRYFNDQIHNNTDLWRRTTMDIDGN